MAVADNCHLENLKIAMYLHSKPFNDFNKILHSDARLTSESHADEVSIFEQLIG